MEVLGGVLSGVSIVHSEVGVFGGSQAAGAWENRCLPPVGTSIAAVEGCAIHRALGHSLHECRHISEEVGHRHAAVLVAGAIAHEGGGTVQPAGPRGGRRVGVAAGQALIV